MQRGVRADPGVVTDADAAEDPGSHTDVDTVPQSRGSFGTLSSVDGHAVSYQAVVPDDGSGADPDPPLVGDVEPPADIGPRVDVDPEAATDAPVDQTDQRRRELRRPAVVGGAGALGSVDHECPPPGREHVVAVHTEILADRPEDLNDGPRRRRHRTRSRSPVAGGRGAARPVAA
jgi:hypothetical protein